MKTEKLARLGICPSQSGLRLVSQNRFRGYVLIETENQSVLGIYDMGRNIYRNFSEFAMKEIGQSISVDGGYTII